MPISSTGKWIVLLSLLAAPAGAFAAAGDCRGFSWDVAHERALFAGTASSLAAGADSGSAPSLTPAHLYALQLKPLAEVHFVASPGKRNPADGGFAGLAILKIATAGTYRIAVDAPVWIDVVADGGLTSVKDFQGAHDCDAPRKILAYDFPVPREVTLQISGATTPLVRIGITPAGN